MCNNFMERPATFETECSEHKEGLSEEFLMFSYKVVPCSRRYPHDWASCPCGHKGERASRRDLRTHPYVAIACSYAKQKQTCPRGDSCPHAHNLFEYWLHPQRYRTELCQYGSNCERPVCFFAHRLEELRMLDPSLPPAETCWSAGAAVSARSRAQVACSATATAANYLQLQYQQQYQQQQYQQQQYQQHQQQQQVILVDGGAAVSQAAAAVQMQVAACSSGMPQLFAAQLPSTSFGVVSKAAATAASSTDDYLLQQQLWQQQQLLAMAAQGQDLPLLSSRAQQQQQLAVPPMSTACLPSSLPLTSTLWSPGSSSSSAMTQQHNMITLAAVARQLPADSTSSTSISSSWSTSSMVDTGGGAFVHAALGPLSPAGSMLGHPLAGSASHSPVAQVSNTTTVCSNAWTTMPVTMPLAPQNAAAASMAGGRSGSGNISTVFGACPGDVLVSQPLQLQVQAAGLPAAGLPHNNGSGDLACMADMLTALQTVQLHQFAHPN